MTDAEKREKVVRGLECCIVRDPDAKSNCVECPYNHEGIITNAPCANGLMADALAVLKELEPRVITWNEILRLSEIESPPVWLEDNDKIHVVPAFVIGSLLTLQNGAITFILRGKRIGANKSDYGTRWRAWTAKPTPEQIRDTPWEEDSDASR